MFNEIFNCECGRSHNCLTKTILIGENVIDKLSDYLDNYNHILLVSDINTYNVAGEKIYKKLNNKIDKSLVLKNNGGTIVIPNEESIDEINKYIKDVDLVFGVGSGVINDLCKITSFNNNIPYMIFATAPSMDGYVSKGSALILKGMKVTLNALPPLAVFSDINILKDAPIDMIKSGYGDIIGKFSCLNDWKLSSFINNEYFCQKIYDKVLDTAKEISTLSKEILKRDKVAIGKLMEALVDVGLAMSYTGNSRPASGSEHHFSHFFEITGIIDNTKYFPHGIDVGFSSIITSKIREYIINNIPERKIFNKDKWEGNIKRVYKNISNEVITLQEKLNWYNSDDSIFVLNNWDKIIDILREAPSSEETLKMINNIDLNFDDFLNLYNEKKLKDALLYAKDLKDRYTILWLYYMYFRGNDD